MKCQFPYRDKEFIVTQNFGNPSKSYSCGWHTGEDAVGTVSKDIYPIMIGTVILAEWDDPSWGNHVMMRHVDEEGQFYTSHYAHLQTIKVLKGDVIGLDKRIGIEGSTGHSSGSHLHYELMKGGYHYPTKSLLETPEYLDPHKFIKNMQEVEKLMEQIVSDWAKNAQAWVIAEKISDGTRPKDPVTREEMWVMLLRLTGVLDEVLR